MKPHTLIVGGGWAGLATAVELTHQGLPVTLLESAKQLGGRARSTPFDEMQVDNGQHLLIGAYTRCLEQMVRVGVDLNTRLLRLPFKLKVRDREGAEISLGAGRLPAPLHLLWGFITASGLSWKERLKAIQFSTAMAMQAFSLPEDRPLSELLSRYKQPDILIKALWEPLCLATLNAAPEQASAQVFLRVLKDAFARGREDSDLIFPASELGQIFPDAAREYLSANGARCLTQKRLRSLQFETGVEQSPLAISCSDGSEFHTDYLVLATPPQHTRQWLQDHPDLQPIVEQLEQFSFDPITTIYLQYPKATRLGQPMQGLIGSHGQWLIDRGEICAQSGLMAVVISGQGEHMAWDKETLAHTIIEEMTHFFPNWPAPLKHLVIREKQATFHCRPGINDIRPGNRTPHPQLWLAGDYTNTGYPATLEGAVRSGVECAQQIIEQSRKTR